MEENDIVKKFEWLLRHFDEIQPLDKQQFMTIISQIYDKYNYDKEEQYIFNFSIGNAIIL